MVTVARDDAVCTGTVAEAALVVIAAVSCGSVGVKSGSLTVLQGAQGPAGVVSEAVLVVVAAVSCAAVGVAAGQGAVGVGADRDGSLDGGLDVPGVAAVVAAPSAAVAAVGGDGHDQHGRQHGAQRAGQ